MSTPDTPQNHHLPFDPRELVSMRVTLAQFARMCGVSKQAVSGWKKRGIITIGPDGKLDPHRAAQQVIRNTDPGKLRARVLKEAVEDHQTTRDRAAKLQAEIEELRETLRAERSFRETYCTHADDLAKRVAAFCDAITADFPALAAAHAAGTLEHALDRLSGRTFYGLTDAAMDAWDEDSEAAGEA